MRDGSPKRLRRRRASRADDPYAHFYATYYGLDEPTGPPPRRHRADASRTGAALVAGVAALMHRKATVIAALGTAVLAVLAVGVLISATRTGSDPEHSPSLVDTTGSPTAPGSVLAGGSTSHAAPSSAARAGADGGAPSGSVAGGDVPVIAAPPVNAAPPVTAAPQTSPQPPSQTRQPPAGGAGGKPEPSGTPTSTQGSPPPSRTHTSSATPPPPSTQPPSSSPTPSPSRTCLLVDPLDRAHCLLPRP